jgi:hypothetical protein
MNRTTDTYESDFQTDYDRMSFNLSYAYDPKRELGEGGIDGKPIPNAYRPTSRGGEGKAPGDWVGEIAFWEDNPYLQTFANAINEAVHEALEWAKVDRKPFLDPHGPHENDVFNAVSDLVFALWDMVDVKGRNLEPSGE